MLRLVTTTEPSEQVEPLLLESLEFYRPWCRYCGATSGPCEIADDQPWVEDVDDIGYPVCTSCIKSH